MGFHDLTNDPPSHIAGYNEFIDSPFTRTTFTLDPNRCMNLLCLFRPQPE